MPFSRAEYAFAATGVALAIVLSALGSGLHSRLGALAMVIAVVAAGAILVRVLGLAEGLVGLLILTSLIDRYTFPLGPVNIRAEQIAALLAAAVVLVVRVREGRLTVLRPSMAETVLLAWFLVGLLSSLLVAPNHSQSIRVLALLVVSSLALVVPWRLLEDDAQRLSLLVRLTLIAFALESAFSMVAYFAHVFGPTIAMSTNTAGGHLNEYGTLWEPNVLGAVCGAGAAAWTYLGQRHFKHAWIGIALCLGGCVVSFARAAWLAIIIVLTIRIVTALRERVDIRQLWIGEVATLGIVALMVIAESVGNYTAGAHGVGGAIGAVGNSADLIGRLRQIQPVFQDLKHSPLIGGGIDSFGERHITAGVQEHLANLEFTVLNDTGIVGLAVFVAFGVVILIAAWRLREDAMVVGLSAMVLVILLANQATETLELMITWLLLGLLYAALQQANARRARGSGT